MIMNDETSKLTDKQRRWIDEYCVDFNSAAAARRAGYSEKTAHQIGYENLRKPDLKQAIEERLDDLSLRAAQITQLLSAQAIGQVPSSVREVEGPDGEVTRVTTYNSLGALDKLARVRGLYEKRLLKERQFSLEELGVVILPTLAEEPDWDRIEDGDPRYSFVRPPEGNGSRR